MLAKERDLWNKKFKAGEMPISPVLVSYRESMNTLDKKLPNSIEILCAYIIYLENLNKPIKKKLNSEMENKISYWNNIFNVDTLPDIKSLNEYRAFRNSESKRSTRIIEELCEYALYLEKISY